MSAAWATIENAVSAWVRAGSGLDSSHVIWERQNGRRPTSAFISLALLSVRPIGQDWLRSEDAEDPEDGADILYTAEGHREVTLQMQCFAGAATGATSPEAILEGVATAARLPTRRAALSAAGFGLAVPVGPIQSIPGVIGSSLLEPRAVLEVRGFVASDATELGTYIESAEVTDEVFEETFTVERP